MADNQLRIAEVPNGLVVTGVRLDEKDFVTSHAAGVWGMGTYTGARPAPTYDEIAQLAYYYICTNRVAGKMATISKTGWLPNGNSSATTRSCQAPEHVTN